MLFCLMPAVRRPSHPDLHYELDDYTDPWRKASYILLQHGFARSSRFWYQWVPYLSRYYKVIRPDLRGFGTSSKNFDLSSAIHVDAYLDDLEAILDHAGAHSVHYCGESMGGIIGILAAAQRPQRVRTLSLVSTPMQLNEAAKRRGSFGHASQAAALRALGAYGYAQSKNTADRFPPGTDPDLMHWFAHEQGKSDIEVMIAMQKLFYSLDTTPYLPKIKAPLLAIYPSHDTHTTSEQLDLLRSCVANHHIVNIPQKHHNLHCIRPATCATQVLHFAARHDGIACHEQ
jgi:3-oxoadipate enol-lactonase